MTSPSLLLLLSALLFSGTAQAETSNPFAFLFGEKTKDTTPPPSTELNAALRAQEAGDYAKAATLFLPLAEKGDAVAQFNLGVLYSQGRVIMQDNKIAMQWYLAAAEQGHAQAQANAGQMYDRGSGVPQDYKKAMRWLELSAKQHNATAQFYIGEMYAQGRGVPQNATEAIKWYRLAADQGNASASAQLAECYEKGLGVPQDSNASISWMRTAINNASDERSRNDYLARQEVISKNMQARKLASEQQAAEHARAEQAAREETERNKTQQLEAVRATERAAEQAKIDAAAKAELDARMAAQRLAEQAARAEQENARLQEKALREAAVAKHRAEYQSAAARRRAEIQDEVARHRAMRQEMKVSSMPRQPTSKPHVQAQVQPQPHAENLEPVTTPAPKKLIDFMPNLHPTEKSKAAPEQLSRSATPVKASHKINPNPSEGKIHYPAKTELTDQELGNAPLPDAHTVEKSKPTIQIEWSKKTPP